MKNSLSARLDLSKCVLRTTYIRIIGLPINDAYLCSQLKTYWDKNSGDWALESTFLTKFPGDLYIPVKSVGVTGYHISLLNTETLFSLFSLGLLPETMPNKVHIPLCTLQIYWRYTGLNCRVSCYVVNAWLILKLQASSMIEIWLKNRETSLGNQQLFEFTKLYDSVSWQSTWKDIRKFN